jgi:hypothetical protein
VPIWLVLQLLKVKRVLPTKLTCLLMALSRKKSQYFCWQRTSGPTLSYGWIGHKPGSGFSGITPATSEQAKLSMRMEVITGCTEFLRVMFVLFTFAGSNL